MIKAETKPTRGNRRKHAQLQAAHGKSSTCRALSLDCDPPSIAQAFSQLVKAITEHLLLSPSYRDEGGEGLERRNGLPRAAKRQSPDVGPGPPVGVAWLFHTHCALPCSQEDI